MYESVERSLFLSKNIQLDARSACRAGIVTCVAVAPLELSWRWAHKDETMNKHAVHAILARALCVAVVAMVVACTPLQVVTHTVSQSETRVPPGQYELDPHHWSIAFDVDHFKYSRFTMRFDRTTAKLDWSEGGLDRSS